MEAIALCGLGHTEIACQQLLQALPRFAAGDYAEPRAIYDLFTHPLPPAIGRLRKIVDIV
jgi:hypothetical protein